MPDFSLRVSQDVQILRIRRVQWLAAIRASYFQQKQAENGGVPLLDADGEQIDVLTQELEKVDCVDPNMAGELLDDGFGLNRTTTTGTDRERTASLAPTISSEKGLSAAEQDKLLAQHQGLVNLTNSTTLSMDSPVGSGRSTPTLTGKQKSSLPQAGSSSPPSLTGSRTSKNRALT